VPIVPVGQCPHERVTVLGPEHPLAPLARAYGAGQRWFPRLEIEQALGRRVDSRAGAVALATAGFAMLSAADSRIELRAADPRIARIVNRARLGPQRRGYRIHRVLEAFLCLPPKKQRRHSATDDRRLEVARLMQSEWLLDGDDVLNCRPFARLSSAWTL
jgi:hypothetical protein